MAREYYIYTTQKCDECSGAVVYDPHRNEYYCLKCGLVQDDGQLKLKEKPSNL